MAKIVLRRHTTPEYLTYLLCVFPFFLAMLIQLLGLPGLLKYVMDVAWCMLFIMMYIHPKVYIKKKHVVFICVIGCFFLYTLLGYLFHYQSAIYYLWGFRNNFRYYVAFLAFITYFKERDVKFLLKLMDTLFWVNVVVSFIQFFVLDYRQDYLGGIFGVERGCNGHSLLFFGIVVSRSVLSYMNGQEKTLPCFMKAALSLVIAAMAELKMYFVVFIIILAMSSLLTKFSFRKFCLMLVAAILVMLSVSLLSSLFGSNNKLSLERIIQLTTASNYATTEDLGRLTAIPRISKTILTDLPSKLFGMGLGNCETSSFEICNTPFFKAHSHLHYTWFTSACLFLETGYVGLGIYLSFFVTCFFKSLKHMKTEDGNLLHYQVSLIIAVLCVILTFYNASLRADVGYLAYFALALPHVRK